MISEILIWLFCLAACIFGLRQALIMAENNRLFLLVIIYAGGAAMGAVFSMTKLLIAITVFLLSESYFQ